jgi:hypothetical protein
MSTERMADSARSGVGPETERWSSSPHAGRVEYGTAQKKRSFSGKPHLSSDPSSCLLSGSRREKRDVGGCGRSRRRAEMTELSTKKETRGGQSADVFEMG